MPRRSPSKKDRARIFEANDGTCHLCGGKIGVGEAWEVEHVIAWELSRDDSDENRRPAHVKCHKVKTHKQDRPAINEAKRREAVHLGVKRPEGKLRSAGFPKAGKPLRISTKQHQPPKMLYQRASLLPAGHNREGD